MKHDNYRRQRFRDRYPNHAAIMAAFKEQPENADLAAFRAFLRRLVATNEIDQEGADEVLAKAGRALA